MLKTATFDTCCVLRAICITVIVACIIIKSTSAATADQQQQHAQGKKMNVDQVGSPGSNVYDRQINEVTGIGGYPGYQMYLPQVLLGIFMPVAILIGIGLIILKLFIIALWAYSRSGGYGGFSPLAGGYGYGGGGGYYPQQYAAAAATNAWRYDAQPLGRSLGHDRDDQPISPFIGPTVMSLVDKVSQALSAFDKKHGAAVRSAVKQ